MDKFIFWAIAITVFFSGVFYFSFDGSYQKSIEAKYFYTIGEYERAYELASDAYELDKYNKMAFSVMNQSRISMRFQEYVEKAKSNREYIDELISDGVTKEERLEIKMVCEIMLERYKLLNKTVLTDDELVEEAKKQHRWFRDIYTDIFGESAERKDRLLEF